MLHNKSSYIIIILVFLISIIYSYPNIYGEDPAIIIKTQDKTTENKIDDIIEKLNIRIKSLTKTNLTTIIRFESTEDQFNAFEILKQNQSDLISISQNIIHSEKINYLEKIKAYPMKLGLDLRGGVHIVIKINTDSFIQKNIEKDYNILKKSLKNLKYKNIKIKDNKYIQLIITTNDDKNKLTNIIKEILPHFTQVITDTTITLKLEKKYKLNIKNTIINKTLSVITNRINDLGIAETITQRHGNNKITIDLPGIQNIEYAKNMLGKTATLDFMLLETNPKYKKQKNKIKISYDKQNKPVLLKNKSILTGNSIIQAHSGLEHTFNKPCVNIKIDEKSAKIFKRQTTKNIGNPMAIIYKETYIKNDKEETKEKIISIANIMSPLGEQFQITGLNIQEAKDLAILLKSGSLPTTVSIIEEKVIGPSLGENNITNSTKSLIISFFIIILFMLIRYKKLGIISNIALILNITLLISIMSIIGVTLTLSGMAGIILTIGMSIDANILIFERIKEEIKITSNINSIVENGFKNSFSSIIDANITTLIMALILFVIGAGPIKGFAITLSLGIITSIYSSLFVTKNIIKFLIEKNIKII